MTCCRQVWQRQKLACDISFTLALLFKQHSGLDLFWWSARQRGKNWPPARTMTRQTESLSHSSQTWLRICKATHSEGLVECSCQNRGSVDEQDSWYLLSCLVVGSAVELYAGYQTQAQEWILTLLSLTGVGALSTALQRRPLLVMWLCASSRGHTVFLSLGGIPCFANCFLINQLFGKKEHFCTTFTQPA